MFNKFMQVVYHSRTAGIPPHSPPHPTLPYHTLSLSHIYFLKAGVQDTGVVKLSRRVGHFYCHVSPQR